MFPGLDGEKLLIIAVVALILVGPERLPRLAEALARLTVRARDWLGTAKDRVKEEMGEEFDDIEWRKMDPRQYDPRRIIRDALLEDTPPAPLAAPAAAAASAATAVSVASTTGESVEVPFDDEAT